MPIYTCTIAESTLSADTKHALAGEIARIPHRSTTRQAPM
jgi:phenylpyruvate tautomerase PptA (4-oxalocrotonate tautomerase family)